MFQKEYLTTIGAAVVLCLLTFDNGVIAQNNCPKGMVCISSAAGVPDIGPLPDSIRRPFGKREELGKLLFCDHRLSADNKYACAQCHQPQQGFSVALILPLGVGGLVAGFRNSPTLYNVDYSVDSSGSPSKPLLLWDGRAGSLEEHLGNIDLSPVKSGPEMGMRDAKFIMDKFRSKLPPGQPDTQEYTNKFRAAFPSASDMDFPSLVQAIAAYERTIVSVDSPFDLYVQQYLKNHPEGLPNSGPFQDLGIEKFKKKEWDGMLLFRGEKGRCILCHYGPNFTDNKFHNVGWPAEHQNDGSWKYKLMKKNGHVDVTDPGRYCEQYEMLDDPEDRAAHRVAGDQRHGLNRRVCIQFRSNKAQENGAFKTPTLRSVEETWPYMHDGGMPDFEELRTELDKDKKIEKALRPVLDFFSKGGGRDNPFKDPLMQKLDLTEEEISNLTAFLRSLTGKKLDEKITNNCPFPPIGSG